MNKLRAIRVWQSGTGKLLGWHPVKEVEREEAFVSAISSRSLSNLEAGDCFESEEKALLAAVKSQPVGGPAVYQPEVGT